MIRRAAAATVAMLASCGRGTSDRTEAVSADSVPATSPADSLAVSGPGGVEIWFTHSRSGTAPDGRRCTDRAIEVRRGAQRIPVPLLYTGEAPRIVNDSTARAILYTNCRAGDAYLVDLRNGRPTRERT
jgi:hypothetical protein